MATSPSVHVHGTIGPGLVSIVFPGPDVHPNAPALVLAGKFAFRYEGDDGWVEIGPEDDRPAK